MKSQNNHQLSLTRNIILPFEVLFCLIFILLFANVNFAQDGEAIFKQNCSACHKLGMRLVGPDLTGVTTKRSEEWLMKWTRSSQTLIKSGDADAKAIYEEFGSIMMPDQTISDGDIKAVYAFIAGKTEAATAAVPAVTEVVVNASADATPEVIELGKNLFIGSSAFSNGGAACIACHNVNYSGVIPGGLLAKDLTTAHSRLGGDAGILGILGAPPFPAMTQAYKGKAITETEIAALTAFLNKVDKDTANQVASSPNLLLVGGAGGLGGLLVVIYLLWFVRKKDTVKKDIYNRQLKSI